MARQRKKACAGAAVVETRHRGVPTDVPLTEAQRCTLQAGRLIGYGSRASVYERPDGKVVKVTSDKSDIVALGLLRNHPRVVKAFKTGKLKDRDAYYAILERLTPAATSYNIGKRMQLGNLNEYLFWYYRESERKGTPRYGVDPVREIALQRVVCAQTEGAAHSECKKAVAVLVDIHNRLGRHGLHLFDFHPHQFAVDAKGRWKLLDVGYGGPAIDHVLAELARAKRFRGRR